MISTDSYVNKIIRLSIQTGFVTAAGALLDLILFLSVTNSTFNFMFDFPLSKLYTNALISTLNARPWQEHVSQHEAPNALFEQSNLGQSSFSGQGQTSFTLVQRGRTHSQGQQSYSLGPSPHQHPYSQASKFDTKSPV
ncbi:hypothetical protein DFH08DRAFT_854518 [Mycena albidolilacea]|uniref:DUF6534 domain-containing protein n=1 Tax=Mycena albidolilacea TaxID=1033008 RepID=A0AAD7AC16_9AGAR|nr:hypothetical protein DFH08DRAFT_854518 [Mycena albidolilacea]